MARHRARYEAVPGEWAYARESAGLSQREASRAIGASDCYVSNLERARFAFPAVDAFMDLCDLYDVDPRDMFRRCYRRVGPRG